MWTTVDGDKSCARVLHGAVRVGNAPVSFGVYSKDGDNPPFEQVLDAIASAGYQGTELGPYGYFPTSSTVLASVLRERNLALASSFVGLPLEDPTKREAAVAECLEVARLLATQGVGELIVADDDNHNADRTWSDGQWKEAARTLHAIARALRDELKMRVVLHHHADTFIESNADIDRLMFETDPELIGLLADTGHLIYGGADPIDVLARHAARVRYVHLKDVDPRVLAETHLNVHQATARNVFCPLGDGCVDISRFVEKLRSLRYDGWVIVEQDVITGGDFDPAACAKRSRELLRKLVNL